MKARMLKDMLALFLFKHLSFYKYFLWRQKFLDIMTESPHISCVACAGVHLRFFGKRKDYAYYRCADCATLQLVPFPDKSQLDKAYQDEYASVGHCQAAPETRNLAASPQFEALVQLLMKYGQPERVLEYGPGWGGLLDCLQSHHIQGEGLELSAEMADYCATKGYTIYRNEISELEHSESYDAILMSYVFEHLVNHKLFFEEAQRLLKSEGLFISTQPTAAFASFFGRLFRLGLSSLPLPELHSTFSPPWHTVLFSTKGMTFLAEKHGFEILEIRPAPIQQEGGFTGLIQRVLSLVNSVGVACFGINWPLVVGHIFVFKKRS